MPNLIIFSDGSFAHCVMRVLNMLGQKIGEFAAWLGVKETVFYLVSAALAIVVGLLGYRLIKLISSVGFATVGYFTGVALFDFVNKLLYKTLELEMLPFFSYVFGGVVTALFLFLGFKKYSYIFFAGLFVAFYQIIFFFTQGASFSFANEIVIRPEWILCIGGAFFAALLCMCIVRVSAVLLTGFGGALVLMSCVADVLPEVSFLQYHQNHLMLLIALGVGLVFSIVQFISARHYVAT